jgi:cytochrome c553
MTDVDLRHGIQATTVASCPDDVCAYNPMTRPLVLQGKHRIPARAMLTITWLAIVLVAGVPLAAAAVYPASTTRPAIPDTIQQRAKACTSCHGEHGEGAADSSDGPRLAGKPTGYLLLQLRYFQSGQRKNVAMEYVLRELDVDYMHKLANYFANQQVRFRQPPQPKASAAMLRRGEQLAVHGDPAIGVPACNSCHGSKLTGVQPLIPGLIGLSSDYVETQLVAWRDQTRAAKEPFCMGVVANRMRTTDVTAISAWLASQVPAADMQPEPANAQTTPLPGWCVMSGNGGQP